MTVKDFKSNEELVALLQVEMTDEGFEELFIRFTSLMYSVRSTYPIPGFLMDDYFQEGRIIMLKAIQLYDVKRQAQFSGFMQLLYKNHMCNMLRRMLSDRRHGAHREISIDAHCGRTAMTESTRIVDYLSSPSSKEPENVMLVQEKAERYLKQLSSFEKEVILCSIFYSSYQEIADILGVSETAVRSAISRARRKIKDQLDEPDL